MNKNIIRKMNRLYKNNKGFTLVELMVSISIFMIIMIMAMGSLIVASDSARKAKELRIAMDNINFAMESMTRSIRMGTEYSCDGSPISDGGVDGVDCRESISFISDRQVDTSYFLNEDNSLMVCKEKDCSSIVSPQVSISNLNFIVRGVGTGDGIQPSVYITIKGSVSLKGEETSFALQTLASQRNLE